MVPSFKTKLPVIPEEPENDAVAVGVRGRSLKRADSSNQPVSPARENAPNRPRQIALLVSKRTEIPPFSAATVPGKLKQGGSGLTILQPLIRYGEDGEFVSPRCAVNVENGETKIQVTNLGRSPVVLREGQELNEVDPDPNDSIISIPNHSSRKLDLEFKKMDPDFVLPEISLDSSLDCSQKQALQAILYKHAFST